MRSATSRLLVPVVAWIVSASPARAALEIAPLAGGGPVDGPALAAALHEPKGLAVAPNGDVFVAIPHMRRVYKVDSAGTWSVAAGNGRETSTGAGRLEQAFSGPLDIALGPGADLYVVNACAVERVSGETVTRFAGTGACGETGVGGPAQSARLNRPKGIAVDPSGNVYLSAGHRILRVDGASGILTVAAGTGVAGAGGDGGAGPSAQLNSPAGLALDGAGNLLIADTANSKVRVLSPSGTLSTLAGTGVAGSSGDGGPALLARFLSPTAVAVGAGAIYVADYSAHRVRRIDGTTGIITTFAGTGTWGDSGDGGAATSAQVASPSGLAVSAGGLLVSSSGGYRVRRITPAGTIGAFAGRGADWTGVPARQVSLSVGRPACMDYTGAVWFGEDNGLWRVDPLTGLLTTRVGGVSGLGATALACSGTRVAMGFGPVIYLYDQATSTFSQIAGTGVNGFSGDGGPALQAQFSHVAAVAYDGLGNLYVADRINQRVRWIEASTGIVRTLAGTGVAGYSGDGGPASAAQVSNVTSLTVGATELFIGDWSNYRVRAVNLATRQITTVAGNGTFGSSGDGGPALAAQIQPYGLAVGFDDSLYIAELSTGVVRRVDPLSHAITRFAGSGYGYSGDDGLASAAQLSAPAGLALGPHGRMLVDEWDGGLLRLLHTDGARGDFDGDGRTDLVLRRPAAFPFGSADVRIWTMNGTTRVSDAPLGGLSSSYAVVGSHDFTGDGRSDLVVSMCGLDCRFYVAPLAGSSVSGPLQEIGRAPATQTVGATHDFNGDGRPDILWYDTASRRLQVSRMQGAQIQGTLTPSPDMHTSAAFRVLGAGDVNGDSTTDIVWHDASTRRTEIWLLNASLQRTATLTGVEVGVAGWTAVAAGDFGTAAGGVPGTLDLLWRNSSSGRLVVWHLDRTGRRTLGLFTSPSEADTTPAEYTVAAPR